MEMENLIIRCTITTTSNGTKIRLIWRRCSISLRSYLSYLNFIINRTNEIR